MGNFDDILSDTPIRLTSKIDVKLIDSMGSDRMILAAARVSTQGEMSAELQDLISKEDLEGTINYLMKHRHGTPFEHSSMIFFVKAPIFVWREWHRHRIGFCVSGDTEVMLETICNSGRSIRKRRISDLYERWHNGVKDKSHVRAAGSAGYSVQVEERVRHLPKCRDFTCRVLNEETQFFELGKPVEIIQSGVKEMLLVETASKSLKCSADHRIYTQDGWAKANELRAGDRIAVCGRRSKFKERVIPPSLRRGIGVWTSIQRDRLIGETDRCYVCDAQYDRSVLVLDHVIPVVADITKALDVSNLKPICPDCNRIKTAGEQKLAKRGNVAGSKFVRLVSSPQVVSEEMSYDVSMGGDHHNFVANGIVVHNSYNEESARYKPLEPLFYMPDPERPMFRVDGWKPGRPKFDKIDTRERQESYERLCDNLKDCYAICFQKYTENLNLGFDPGLARDCLPVGIFSSCWVTCNPRSLMAFLSLRTHEPEANNVSYPLHEIEIAARSCEKIFSQVWPITYAAFVRNGRTGP